MLLIVRRAPPLPGRCCQLAGLPGWTNLDPRRGMKVSTYLATATWQYSTKLSVTLETDWEGVMGKIFSSLTLAGEWSH